MKDKLKSIVYITKKVISKLKGYFNSYIDFVDRTEQYKDNSIVFSTINMVINFCIYMIIGVGLFFVLVSLLISGTYILFLPYM